MAQPYIGRLAIKISLFTSLVIIIVMASVLGVLVVTESGQIRGDITANAEAYARLTYASYYQDYIQNYTRPQAEDFRDFAGDINELLSNNADVKKVSVISVSGRIMYESDEAVKGKYTGEPRRITDQALLGLLKRDEASQRLITQDGAEMLEILQPVPEASGSHVFVVRYLVSFDSLQARIGTIYKDALVIAAVLLPLSVGLAVLFSIPITRPVVRLTRASEQLGSGEYDNLGITAKSHDEIGQLARSFARMADDIQHSRHTIETKNRQLVREKARLSASINSLALGYIMTDRANNIVIINQAAKMILARSQAHPHLLADGAHTLAAIAKRLATALDLPAKIEQSRTSGTPFTADELAWEDRFLRIFISPILVAKGEDVGVVIVLEDITELTIIQRSKDEFFAIASHELRTPLAVMMGNLSLITDYSTAALKDKDLNTRVMGAVEAGDRMVKLVDDFLDMSSLEQGTVDFSREPFDIAMSAQKVVDSQRAAHSNSLVKLVFEPPKSALLVAADERRVTQVLNTLVENAYKATQRGEVTVHVARQGEMVHVEVSDTGLGIAPEAQPLLFHKMQQAVGDVMTRSSNPGVGLSLYIARLLVEGMGGEISLERSAPGEGSRFGFTLPLQ